MDVALLPQVAMSIGANRINQQLRLIDPVAIGVPGQSAIQPVVKGDRVIRIAGIVWMSSSPFRGLKKAPNPGVVAVIK